jgi:putative drug exporter of the RND superfamily
MLQRVARWCYHRRWTTVGLWVAALVLFGALGSSIGGEYSQDFSLPGTDSQRAYDLLKDKFPQAAGDSADVVFKADAGIEDPDVQAAMEGLFAKAAGLDHVEGVVSPYTPEGTQQISPDGTIAFATIHYENLDGEVPLDSIEELKTAVNNTETEGLDIELGGQLIAFTEFQEPGSSEGIGLLIAMFILLVTFGSVLAMTLPIMTAIFGIAIGIAILFLSANVLSVPDFAPQLASMIGLGVGVDYALFIVTRYRQLLHSGHEPEDAVIKSIVTSGRAVLFAGTIVVISFLGILLMGFTFVQGVAIGGAATVLVTMLASVTLLPAVLGFVGKKIDKLRLPWFHRSEANPEHSFWFKWSRYIQRRPWVAATAGLVILVTLAIPLFSLRLGLSDTGSGSEKKTSRRAYDILTEGFGPGFNGPLLLAAELGSPGDMGSLDGLVSVLESTDGVALVTPPFPNEAGDTAILTVFPTTSPQDEETSTLVKHLRNDVVPDAMAGTDTTVYVGGLTAGGIDFADKSGERLPVLIGVVILLSFLLLVAVFRSVLVPLKAAIMNLLSIGAAYGVVVAVFQWGWGASLIGVETKGPIEAWVPMMLFTILFGLSMDYEIFLLSRVREEYVRTKNNDLAVANGLASTARVITAAAAIMVAIFLTFVFGFDERAIKLFGLGLASAIFVDATIVRMVLVPATMELLGDANWWFPKWLDRIVPKISVDADVDAELLDELAVESGVELDSESGTA